MLETLLVFLHAFLTITYPPRNYVLDSFFAALLATPLVFAFLWFWGRHEYKIEILGAIAFSQLFLMFPIAEAMNRDQRYPTLMAPDGLLGFLGPSFALAIIGMVMLQIVALQIHLNVWPDEGDAPSSLLDRSK
jgi:hypothetical protein